MQRYSTSSARPMPASPRGRGPWVELITCSMSSNIRNCCSPTPWRCWRSTRWRRRCVPARRRPSPLTEAGWVALPGGGHDQPTTRRLRLRQRDARHRVTLQPFETGHRLVATPVPGPSSTTAATADRRCGNRMAGRWYERRRLEPGKPTGATAASPSGCTASAARPVGTSAAPGFTRNRGVCRMGQRAAADQFEWEAAAAVVLRRPNASAGLAMDALSRYPRFRPWAAPSAIQRQRVRGRPDRAAQLEAAAPPEPRAAQLPAISSHRRRCWQFSGLRLAGCLSRPLRRRAAGRPARARPRQWRPSGSDGPVRGSSSASAAAQYYPVRTELAGPAGPPMRRSWPSASARTRRSSVRRRRQPKVRLLLSARCSGRWASCRWTSRASTWPKPPSGCAPSIRADRAAARRRLHRRACSCRRPQTGASASTRQLDRQLRAAVGRATAGALPSLAAGVAGCWSAWTWSSHRRCARPQRCGA